MKKFIKLFLSIIITVLLVNYLTLLIWGKDNLLSIAMENFRWNATDYKVDLIIWNGVLPENENYNSLEDFNDSQIKDFIDLIYKNELASTITYKPQNIQIDSIQWKENELNLMVFYKMNYLIYYELIISVYTPGFGMDKTEYLFWFFGWHRFTEPQLGIS